MVAREVSASVQAPEDGDCCLAHTATSDSSGVGCVGRGVEQGKQGVSSKEYGGKKQEGEAKMVRDTVNMTPSMSSCRTAREVVVPRVLTLPCFIVWSAYIMSYREKWLNICSSS